MLYIFVPILIIASGALAWFMFDRYKNKKTIVLLSQLDVAGIIDQQKSRDDLTAKSNTDFNLKLIQSGITLKEYNEARILFAIIGLLIICILPFFVPLTVTIGAVSVGLLLIVFGGNIYLSISKSERVEKINNDLGVFLDLINVILEAGGSLKNAFFQVSNRAHGIIDEELLKEIAILEYEMTNYSTKKAYENLKGRIDSREMDKIVDFLILSEETGIGVKNIFSTQSDEMRQEKFYKIKGKVNTLNMYLMLVIFIFVLPALGAFIIFPMMAGGLEFNI